MAGNVVNSLWRGGSLPPTPRVLRSVAPPFSPLTPCRLRAGALRLAAVRRRALRRPRSLGRLIVGREAAVRYRRTVTSERVREALSDFVRERDWARFHTPANLAKSISIEAGELLECFQWSDDGDLERVREELADVVTYCMLLGTRLGLDLDEIVLEKLAVTLEKYPADRARGRSTKYDSL